jgi:3-dehydroquinate synthase
MLDPQRHQAGHDTAYSAWAETHVQTFSVAYRYDVAFTRDAFDPENPLLVDIIRRIEPDKRHRLAVFIDEGLTFALPKLVPRIARYIAHHGRSMDLVGDIVVVPGGEAVKNDHGHVERMLADLVARRIDRHSYVVAIGGGAVLDAVGFACALFHRGCRHIRFPATVLAQDDSGVGVKNAINAYGQKNLLGTFAPPFAVINDSALLDALPLREKRAGLSEAVKVALIRDGAFFDWMEANADAIAAFEPNAVDRTIRRSAELHMRQIALGGDPFEMGSARPLDFGHWAAHKLEVLTRHDLRHGEAVAVGIALDTRYSVLAGLLPAGTDERVLALLKRLGLPVWSDALDLLDMHGCRRVTAGLNDFREHLGGELTVTLLAGVGRGVEVHEIDPHLVDGAIRWLKKRA